MTDEIRLLSLVTRMNVGGPAVQISTLMRGLAPTPVYQVLLTGQVEHDEMDYLKLYGADLRTLQIRGLVRRISVSGDAEALMRISHFVRGFRPDIIHTHTAKAGLLGRLAAIATRSRAKRVHTFHGHLLHGYFSKRNTNRLIKMEQILARHSDRLIAVGQTVKDDLLNVGIGTEHQYRIIPPGAILGAIPDSNLARLELGIPLDAPTVSYVGRLTSIKRIDRLAQVIDRVLNRIPTAHFVVAGSGTELHILESLRASTGKRLHLLGWRSDVERIFSSSDVTVLTSDNEGTPVSLIQAGMIGVPAVATNVGSVGDVVIDRETGLLTACDSEAIAGALIHLLTSDSERQAMSQSCRTNYHRRFGPDSLVGSHLSLYNELMSGS